MSPPRELPLGRKEGQHLEVEGRDSLEDRHGLGREVVGMLNAAGGEIWIGLAEEDHRAVRVEPVAEAEVEARALRDFLMDRVEPALISGEIEVRVERSEEGEEVLRIAVEGRPERRPYALLRRGGRHYVVRVGDRLRPMTREEVVGEGRSGAGTRGEIALQQVLDELREQEERLRKRGENLLWLRLQPVAGGRLVLQRLELEELLTDPTRSGNQRTRRTFADAAVYARRRPSLRRLDGRQALEVGAEVSGFTRIYRDGTVEVDAVLEYSQAPPDRSDLRLAELVVSVLRLLRSILTEDGIWQERPGGRWVGQLALLGLKVRSLMPQASASEGFRAGSAARAAIAEPYPAEPEEDFTLDRPLVVETGEVIENPDRIAFRMLRELYEAFGYPESEMPAEFDRKTGRLVLPE